MYGGHTAYPASHSNIGGTVMNLRTWLNDWLRSHTKPTEAETAQRKEQLHPTYRQGGLNERYTLLAQLAQQHQSKHATDRALTPNPDYHPSDKLHAYNQHNKQRH